MPDERPQIRQTKDVKTKPPSIEEKLEIARTLKETGNAFFKQKQYKKALGKYTRIFAWVGGLKLPTNMSGDGGMGMGMLQMAQQGKSQLTEEQGKAVDALIFAANLNCAACYLLLKDYQKTIKFTQKVLCVDKENAKALARQGKAYAYLKEYDKSEENLKLAILKNPNDTVSQKLLTNVQVRLRRQAKKSDKEMRKKMKAMFK